MMLDEKMAEYSERFDDLFPLMCCMDMTDEEIIHRIQSCLDDGKPFKPTEGALY